MKNLLYIFAIFICGACTVDVGSDFENKDYEGPMMELEDVVFFYSDSAVVKVKGISPHQMDYANGDREFPKGLYLEFYDNTGKIESTIKANKAFFNKEKQEWLGQGDVVVVNTASGEQLNTEELFWLPSEERIYTDKFVTIKREGEILHGTGLKAAQDLSTYEITDPDGVFTFEGNDEL